MPAKHIPEGFHTVTPFLAINGVAAVVEFMKQAFGATEKDIIKGENGTIMHAELKVGDSIIMLGEARDKPVPAMLYLYVPDCDAVYKKALAAGAESILEPVDQFYGDRSGAVKDSAGNQWWIATHKEDLTPAEIEKRAMAAAKH